MGLREIVRDDIRTILADEDGPQWPVTVIDPSGASASLKGMSNDIGQVIDDDLGVVISGRSASVTLDIFDLADEGLGIPRGIEKTTSKPWIVKFDDIEGNLYTFKVQSSQPDRTVGLVVCILESYDDS